MGSHSNNAQPNKNEDSEQREQQQHRLIFVYGTLKSTESKSWMLQQRDKNICGTLLATARTTRRYPLVLATSFTAPFLVDAEGYGEFVEGEIYMVDDNTVTWLDAFEGHPELYQRRPEIFEIIQSKIIDPLSTGTNIPSNHLMLKSGDLVECEAYFLQHNKLYFAKNKMSMSSFTSAHALAHGKFEASAHLASLKISQDILQNEVHAANGDHLPAAEYDFTAAGAAMDPEELEIDLMLRSLIRKFWDDKRKALANEMIKGSTVTKNI